MRFYSYNFLAQDVRKGSVGQVLLREDSPPSSSCNQRAAGAAYIQSSAELSAHCGLFTRLAVDAGCRLGVQLNLSTETLSFSSVGSLQVVGLLPWLLGSPRPVSLEHLWNDMTGFNPASEVT